MAATRALGYKWNLRALMAERGMFATTDLVPHLAERGRSPVEDRTAGLSSRPNPFDIVRK